MGKSGCNSNPASGQTLVGVLSATFGAAVVFMAMTQVFIQMAKVKTADDREALYNQMLQLTGLSVDNPRTCTQLFTGRTLTYTIPATPSPSPSPGVWGMVAGTTLAPDLFSNRSGSRPSFGPWGLTGSTIMIKSCKQATGPAKGQNCMDPSFVPLSVPTELQGNFRMLVRATGAISGQPQERTREFLVSLLAQTPPTSALSASGADRIYSYTVTACSSGMSAATPAQTANADRELCEKLCFQPLTNLEGTRKTGCWDANTRKCDLSHQICNALDIPRMTNGRCDFTTLVRRTLLKEPSTPGTSRELQPVACWWDGPGGPGPQFNQGSADGRDSTGLPILMNNIGTYRNQLLCKSERDGEIDFLNGDAACSSCARRARAGTGLPQDEQCLNACGLLGLTAWINRDQVLLGSYPECTCGAPYPGLDLCKRDMACP